MGETAPGGAPLGEPPMFVLVSVLSTAVGSLRAECVVELAREVVVLAAEELMVTELN